MRTQLTWEKKHATAMEKKIKNRGESETRPIEKKHRPTKRCSCRGGEPKETVDVQKRNQKGEKKGARPQGDHTHKRSALCELERTAEKD